MLRIFHRVGLSRTLRSGDRGEEPMLTDPIADMLSRIRNANRALHDHVEMPNSKIKQEIARLLKEEGYIRDYHIENGGSFKTLVIDLKYNRSRERAITNLKRISKPGRRIYARKDRLPRVLGGMGVAILSASDGARRGPGAARADALPGREHGRGGHEGFREAAPDPGRRLPRRAARHRPRAERRLLASGHDQAAGGDLVRGARADGRDRQGH